MPNPTFYKYQHQAMATVFELVFDAQSTDEIHAGSLAQQVFREIDQLENELSRFRSGSDIWHISRVPKDTWVNIGLACYDCIKLALDVHQQTHGAFDITLGALNDFWQDRDSQIHPLSASEFNEIRQSVGMDRFTLNSESLTIQLHSENLLFDLGALGKGYALDQAATLLEQQECTRVLLNAGDSSILALDAPLHEPRGWAITLNGSENLQYYQQRALSSSGFQVKGAHIINPHTLTPVPINSHMTHVSSSSAALSDALSTAVHMMTPSQIIELLRLNPDLQIEGFTP
jgi:thiamine biosynthesis lipoprotein